MAELGTVIAAVRSTYSKLRTSFFRGTYMQGVPTVLIFGTRAIWMVENNDNMNLEDWDKIVQQNVVGEIKVTNQLRASLVKQGNYIHFSLCEGKVNNSFVKVHHIPILEQDYDKILAALIELGVKKQEYESLRMRNQKSLYQLRGEEMLYVYDDYICIRNLYDENWISYKDVKSTLVFPASKGNGGFLLIENTKQEADSRFNINKVTWSECSVNDTAKAIATIIDKKIIEREVPLNKKGNSYTREELLCMVEKAADSIVTFYQQDFINYVGKTADTSEYYMEVICEWILDNLDRFDEIPMITREKSYCLETHSGKVDTAISNREEERVAIELFNQKEHPIIGKIIDYQTPLKNRRSDIAGKIDLLSYDGECLRILELKKADSTESMLRCVVEGYTYYKTVNKRKLLADFGISETAIVSMHPLVFVDSVQYRQYVDSASFPNLQILMDKWNCKPFWIRMIGDSTYEIFQE